MNKPINEIERLKLIAGLINEIDYNNAVYGVKKSTLTESKKKEVKELSIDVANPYEYRHGLQHELEQMDDYSDETLEKAKTTVLKNLAKDANFYSTLLNQKQSHYEFKAPETDAPGMQANADGTLKKGAGKLDKSNVKDNLGKKEEGSKKPKGVKVMPDKGVEGKEKVVKEGIDDKVEDMIKSGKIKPEDVKTAAEKAMKGDTTSLVALMAGIKLAEDQVEESKEEMNESFKYFDNYEEFENTLFQLYPQVKANPEKYKKTWKNGEVSYSDGYVNWGSWYPDRPQSYSGLPPGAVNMNNKMSQSDLIYPAGSRMDEDNMESSPTNGDSSAEGQFNDLMSRYDWYYEMSDDPRKYDTGTALDQKLKSLAKTIGTDRAVELFNLKAPSDRKVTSTFFMESKDKHAKLKETSDIQKLIDAGYSESDAEDFADEFKQGSVKVPQKVKDILTDKENKHSKLKELLKASLKKEIINPRDIQAAKTTGDVVNIPVQDTAAQTAAKNAKINFRTYK